MRYMEHLWQDMMLVAVNRIILEILIRNNYEYNKATVNQYRWLAGIN